MLKNLDLFSSEFYRYRHVVTGTGIKYQINYKHPVMCCFRRNFSAKLLNKSYMIKPLNA